MTDTTKLRAQKFMLELDGEQALLVNGLAALGASVHQGNEQNAVAMMFTLDVVVAAMGQERVQLTIGMLRAHIGDVRGMFAELKEADDKARKP